MQNLLHKSKTAIKRAAFVHDIIESQSALIGFYEIGNLSLFIHKFKGGVEFSIIKNRAHIHPQTIQTLTSKKSEQHKETTILHKIANTFTNSYKQRKKDPEAEHILEQINSSLC